MSEHMPDPAEEKMAAAASASENNMPAEAASAAAPAEETPAAEPQPVDVPAEEGYTPAKPQAEALVGGILTPAETRRFELSAAEVPLAWHRFLTRCYLWIAAIYHFAQAALVITGLSYHSSAARDAVYAGLSNLRYLDWGFAALLALGALLQIIARFRLSGRKKNGPGMLFAAYLALLAGQVAYGAGRYVLTSLTPLTGSIVGLSAVYAAMLLVNASYYRKRKTIFNP